MYDQTKLNEFVTMVNQINLSATNTFGSGAPIAASSLAGSSSALEIITKLKLETGSLLIAVKDDKPKDSVTHLMDSIEGNIFNLQTFEVISQDYGNSLVRKLRSIISQ